MAAETSAVTGDAAPSLRQRILRAAFESFMQHGYAGTSTLEIATRAKVSKRDLYSEFGSKQAMLLACIRSRAERMQVPLYLPQPRDASALEAMLVTFGTTVLREMSQPEVLATFRLAIAEAVQSPEIAQTLEATGRVQTMARLAELMRAAHSAGLLGAGDPDAMAGVFMSVLWGGMHVRMLLRTIEPIDAAQAVRQARAAADALLRVYPPARPAVAGAA